LHLPNVKTIVGIAGEPLNSPISSHDIMFLNAANWQEEDFLDAKREQQELGISLPENLVWTFTEGIEYPAVHMTKPIPGFTCQDKKAIKRQNKKQKKQAKEKRKINRKK